MEISMNIEAWNEVVGQIKEEPMIDDTTKKIHSSGLYQNCANNNFIPPFVCGDRSVTDEIYRETRRIQNQLYMLEKRAEFCEAERERRKAQFDAVSIDENGVVIGSTVNTRLQYSARKLTNFTDPQITILYTKGENMKVYMLTFRLGNRKNKIFISENDAGDGKKLLKKLNSTGADFLLEKQNKKINSTVQLLSLLLKNMPDEIELPLKPGWFIDSSGKMKFCGKEKMSWEQLLKII